MSTPSHWQTIHWPFADFRLLDSTRQLADTLKDLFICKVSCYLRSISDPVWIHSGAVAHPIIPARHGAVKGKLTIHFK